MHRHESAFRGNHGAPRAVSLRRPYGLPTPFADARGERPGAWPLRRPPCPGRVRRLAKSSVACSCSPPLRDPHRNVSRVVVHRPRVDELAVDPLEVAPARMEPPSNHRLGHVVAALRHAPCDPCDCRLGAWAGAGRTASRGSPAPASGEYGGRGGARSRSSRRRSCVRGERGRRSASASVWLPGSRPDRGEKGSAPPR